MKKFVCTRSPLRARAPTPPKIFRRGWGYGGPKGVEQTFDCAPIMRTIGMFVKGVNKTKHIREKVTPFANMVLAPLLTTVSATPRAR